MTLRVLRKRVICLNCGYELEISPFYASLKNNLSCPVCTSKDKWKKFDGYYKNNNETWKSLLVTMHPTKFKMVNGEVKLMQKWERYYDELKALKKNNPRLYEILRRFTG